MFFFYFLNIFKIIFTQHVLTIRYHMRYIHVRALKSSRDGQLNSAQHRNKKIRNKKYVLWNMVSAP